MVFEYLSAGETVCASELIYHRILGLDRTLSLTLTLLFTINVRIVLNSKQDL